MEERRSGDIRRTVSPRAVPPVGADVRIADVEHGVVGYVSRAHTPSEVPKIHDRVHSTHELYDATWNRHVLDTVWLLTITCAVG